jgi:hypothetical protein
VDALLVGHSLKIMSVFKALRFLSTSAQAVVMMIALTGKATNWSATQPRAADDAEDSIDDVRNFAGVGGKVTKTSCTATATQRLPVFFQDIAWCCLCDMGEQDSQVELSVGAENQPVIGG